MHRINARSIFFASGSIASLALASTGALAQAAGASSPATPPSIATTEGADRTCVDANGENCLSGDAIVVTGSRLPQQAITSQPILRIPGSTIADYGYTNVGDALTQLPAFGVPGNSAIGQQGMFGAGQTFANMYDLGAQRTLTLVNGNRFVSAANSSLFGAVQGSPVDLGQIAPDLVDHIDVVSVGGAPIYGADAIAGTVNLVLKKNYQGLSLSGSTGLSGKGDAGDYNVSLLAGHNFDDGKGNVTLNVYWDHQDGLATSARSNVTSNFFGSDPTGTYGYRLYSGGLHYSVFSETGMPMVANALPIYGGKPLAAIRNAKGQALYFNSSGHLVPFVDGTVLGNGITEAGGDGFSVGDYGNFLTSSQRIQGTLLTHYDFSDHIRFHGEFWLGRDTATNVANPPYFSSYLFGGAGQTNGNLILSTSNPYLSARDQAIIKANLAAARLPTNAFYMARANTDLETGAFRTQTTTWRVVAGLDGDFSLGTHPFTWEATFNYGHVSSVTTSRELVTKNFYNALNAVRDASGNIVCAPGYTNATIATISGTCAPIDVFGYGNESQAALNYVTAIARTHAVNTQLDLVADLKGDVVTLPAGAAKFVAGYEHRRESQDFDPGAFYRGELQSNGSYAQYGDAIPITPVSGAYHTDEGFGELTVPVISPDMGVPVIHSFDLNGAARYTRDSLTGGFWSYTGGGSLAPVEGLTLRGNYTRSFRSPSVTELFAPTGSSFTAANDPCDSRYIRSGVNPAVRAANCAAAGLPANFTSNIVDLTVQGTSGGNPNLQNEKADSWTAGAAFAPKFAPGLTITGDYVSIDIKNEITEPTVTDLMDACYDSASYPNVAACGTFTRNAAGQVVSFQHNYLNIALESFRAFQGALNYAFPLSRLGLPERAGSISLSANWLHTFRHYYQVGPSDTQLVLDQRSDPSDAVRGNFDWSTRRFDWLWQVSYYGPTRVDPNSPSSTYQYPDASPYWMVDTSIGVQATDNFKIRLVVNNVFNLGVPFPQALSTRDEAKYYEAIMGRYFRMNVQVKF